MKRIMALMAALALVLAACGGGDSSDDEGTDTGTDGTAAGVESSDDNGDNDSGSGEVVDPQPPGQATVSVDGQEFVFETIGPGGCIIETDRLQYSFVNEETSATIAAGANFTDDGWQGDILMRILDEEGRPVQYYLQSEEGLMVLGGIAVDGDSMSFSGPMEMQPPNDGSNPPPVDVGDGTISATCG